MVLVFLRKLYDALEQKMISLLPFCYFHRKVAIG
jgi:hypothetical protein